MKEQIRAKFEAYWDEMMADLAALVAVNSVRGEETTEFPFGKEPARALSIALRQGERMGFAVENVDNYAGTIDLGDAEEMIGVMAHLDIVPAGDGWTDDPFTLTFKNDRIYGRGVVDDKGPVIAALYGMRIIRDLNLPLTKKIRLIVGTNEEQGSGCMKYYAQHRPVTSCGFTPDADYPLIHGEKGNFWTWLSFPAEETPILEISGGNAFNIVPAECVVLLDGSQVSADELKKSIRTEDTEGYEPQFMHDAKGNIKMVVRGHAAHGSTPEKGVNAIVSAAKILCNAFGEKAGKMMHFIAESIGRETDGASLGLKVSDDVSGSLSLNLGRIIYSTEQHRLAIDIRYPVKLSLAEMDANYRKMAEAFDLTYEVTEAAEPHYVPKDSPVVQKLLAVYRQVTGDQTADAFTIGGGTYAKALGKNFVAFGPEFPGSEPMNVHDADEHILKELFLDHCVVCTLGMAALAGE